jgi:hypothetical protein
MQIIGKLDSLKDLMIEGGDITDPGLVPLKGLRGLERLCFQHVNITNNGLPPLLNLKKTKMLIFDHTRVTREGTADLKKALPNAKLVVQ